jgi:very-short-patch-repair endonuclease/transcription elongation GreA/GreB family factor
MPDAIVRLTQVFKFLKELNELRNPVARDLSGYADVLRLDAWPMHPCIAVRRGDRIEEEDADAEAGMEPLIRIQRARLTPCPKPPLALDGWLKPGWQAANDEAAVLESRNFLDDEKKTVTVEFVDDGERVAALKVWNDARTKWCVAERPAIAALKIFERIHTLWSAMQREADRVELVLADGMLAVPSQSVRHPVLMQRIDLEFDPSVPEFRFATGTEKVELHRALLRLVPSIEGRMIAHFDKELELQPVEPLGGDSTAGFFCRLVQGLFNDGEFLDEKPRGGADDRPSIWREPVIFLRARNAGLSTTLDNIIEDLEDEETEPPKGLSRIVGVEAEDDEPGMSGNGDGETRRTPPKPTPDILFSKPANAEQYEIAERLAQSDAVLVQGPPGTGKTHTIANLLGYLLAQGKTVLVTAHTTKALRVLRRQVDEALQPLCLSVLEGDADSQTQLSRAAQDIADRLSRSNAASLRREAGVLRDKRRKMLDVAAALRRKLRDARFSEVEEIVLGGEGMSPIEVSKRVRVDAERDGWIPGPFQPGVTCPLADAEVRQLYATNATLTPSDETQLAVSQPVLADLVSSADFCLLAKEQAGADSRAQAHRPELWSEGAAAGYAATQLQQLHQRVCAAAGVLAEEQNWLREVLFAGWMGGDLRGAWNDLLAAAHSLASEAGTAHRLIMEHGPELPNAQPASAMAATLNAIISHLESGGSLGLMTKLRHRDWHQLIDACRVENRVPTTPDEFRALRALAQLQESRSRFVARWRRGVESLGGPQIESVASAPERAAQGYAAEIHTRLEWRETVWEPLTGALRAAGFRWDAWLAAHPPVPGDHGELARVQRAGSQGLAAIVEAQAALLRQTELSAALQNQRAYLAGFPQSEAASVLLTAQDSWDVENYEEACRELARLEGLREAYDTRLALLARAEEVAPAWSHAIKQRHKPHDGAQPPGDATAAWRWRQWHQELERRAAVSMPELQERLDKTEDELRGVAAQIIEHETWAAQCDRTRLHEQQALMGFVQTIRKIGKGTGKLAPQLLRKARELLASARRAVPVWIMPLSRVYESFDARETKFDVVIIDEASQSDVTALAALYLGREHIVVGDKEQVTPDAVGQRIDDVQRLIATDLQGIPCSHLYDGQTSIYDLAEQAFGGVVALREHFRCVPEIIQFSNHLSYKTIVPLREPHSAPVKPAMVAHRVNGFRDERGKTNEVEAEEIASLVIACIGEPDYARNDFGQATSFGVISLLGDEQALVIENILRMRLSPDVFAKHRLLCGNAAQFQGDERDVVFLSMVDGPPDDGQLSFRDAGPKDLYKKRYNVAVSRARNQLWVVHSIDPDTHLKGGDLRRRLIEHARDPQALMRAMEEQGKRTDSIFEKLVLQRLISAGYRVHPQWPVGARRIDLVVEGKTKRLAVECDGERWHTPEQLHQDLERQSILERLGWIFVRIRGSVFFRDPDTAMAPVFAKLKHLDIEPLGAASDSPSPKETPMLDRVRRQAEAIREKWRTEKLSQEEPAPDSVRSAPPEHPNTATRSRAEPIGQTISLPARNIVQSAPKVEVGDSVRYRYTDAPGDELFHMIVDSESKPDLGLINRDTVVAKALLGMEVGQVREVILPIGARSLEVTELRKHQTQGATPPGGADNFRLVTEINEGFGEDDRNTNNEGATRSGQLALKGQIFAYRNAKEGMLIVLQELANADSTLLQKCAIHPDAQGQSRRYIARTTTELYPNRPDLRRHHEVLPGGWMVATNLNNELKLKIVRLAAKLAGLDLTKDLLIDF